MHIQCPSCQTVFAVEDKEISAGKGRQVRCSICDHIWTTSRQDALTSKMKKSHQALVRLSANG